MKRLLPLIVLGFLLFSCDISEIFDKPKEVVIYGTAIDACDGSPLANATIRDEHLEFSNLENAVTGSDGTYEFRVSSSNDILSIFLLAEKDNYESQTYHLELFDYQDGLHKHIDFKLMRKTIEYRGVVKDVENNPLPYAQVYATILKGSSLNKVGTTFTDSNGNYILSVPNQEYNSWSYSVTAVCDGYEHKTINMGHTPNDNGKNITLIFQLVKE